MFQRFCFAALSGHMFLAFVDSNFSFGFVREKAPGVRERQADIEQEKQEEKE